MPNIPPKPSEFELFMPVILKDYRHNGIVVYAPEQVCQPGFIWAWHIAQEQPERQRPDMVAHEMKAEQWLMAKFQLGKPVPKDDPRSGIVLQRFQRYAQQEEDLHGKERKVVLQLVQKDVEKYRRKRWA